MNPAPNPSLSPFGQPSAVTLERYRRPVSPAPVLTRHRLRPYFFDDSPKPAPMLPDVALVASSAEARALISGRIRLLVRSTAPRFEGWMGVECGGYIVASATLSSYKGPLSADELAELPEGRLVYGPDEIWSVFELWLWELTDVDVLESPVLLRRRNTGLWCQLA